MHAPDSKSDGYFCRLAVRAGIVFALLVAGGCSQPFKIPEPAPEQPVEQQPDPGEPTGTATPPPAAVPKPAPQPPPPIAADLPPPPVTILVSSQGPAYQSVAAALVARLGERPHHVYQLTDADPAQVFAEINSLENPVAVAIGLSAAKAVSQWHEGPAVFCQVFNYQGHGLDLTRMRGVAAYPPLALQVTTWKQLVPQLASVGAILGPGHTDLIETARAAAASADVTLQHRVAASDREALYIFKRMVPELDGLWLFPDNRVLSASVLRDMISYGLRRDVQVVVFNPALLQLGAVMSASTRAEDIAATVLQSVEAMTERGVDAIPELTPLSSMDLEINQAVAEQFGIPARLTQRRLVKNP